MADSRENSAGTMAPNGAARGSHLRWLLWLLPVAWAVFIFWLSSQSHPDIADMGPDFWGKPKVGHYILFLVLSGLLAFTFTRAHSIRLRKAVALAVIIASLYGGTDEFHQIFVPERTPRLTDWMIDT